MIDADQTAPLDAARVLYATALASALRGVEILLVVIVRVREQRHDQAYKCSRDGEGVFDDAHSVTYGLTF